MNKQMDLREVDQTNESMMNEIIHLKTLINLNENSDAVESESNARMLRRIEFLESKLNRQML